MARSIAAPIAPNFLTNFGTFGDRPSMSSMTRIWPSQPGDAPMPMVGIGMALVMRSASGAVIASSTTAKAPASETSRASSSMAVPLIDRAALGFESADHVHGLRRKSDVGHDRNAAIDKIADRLRHAPAAFEFDGAAIGFLHHLRGVAKRDRRALLVSAERHVDDDERALRSPHDRLAMHDHQFKRHRHGGFIAVHHHAQAIADEQEIAMIVGDRSRMRMIGRQRHDRLAAFTGGDIGRHLPAALKVDRHCSPIVSARRPKCLPERSLRNRGLHRQRAMAAKVRTLLELTTGYAQKTP